MNPDVLAKADVQPTESQRARLDGWDIEIAPRATLVPSDGASVYGVLAQLTHPDLEKLYTKDWFGFGTYLPEAVLVVDRASRTVPALCYIAWETDGGTPTADYIDKIVSVARQLEFPDSYIKRIKTFSSGAIKFDAFGKIMVAERATDGWRLFILGADGKRSPAGVPIPTFVAENELAQYLDDIFHESASPDRPCVRRIPS